MRKKKYNGRGNPGSKWVLLSSKSDNLTMAGKMEGWLVEELKQSCNDERMYWGKGEEETFSEVYLSTAVNDLLQKTRGKNFTSGRKHKFTANMEHEWKNASIPCGGNAMGRIVNWWMIFFDLYVKHDSPSDDMAMFVLLKMVCLALVTLNPESKINMSECRMDMTDGGWNGLMVPWNGGGQEVGNRMALFGKEGHEIKEGTFVRCDEVLQCAESLETARSDELSIKIALLYKLGTKEIGGEEGGERSGVSDCVIHMICESFIRPEKNGEGEGGMDEFTQDEGSDNEN